MPSASENSTHIPYLVEGGTHRGYTTIRVVSVNIQMHMCNTHEANMSHFCLSYFTWYMQIWDPSSHGSCVLWPLCPHKYHRVPSFAVGPTSPCTWNVCVTRKAPLVASDSSSSGGSDSEDDEKAAGTVEAVRTSHGGKAPPLPRTEEAATSRCERNGKLAWGPSEYCVAYTLLL